MQDWLQTWSLSWSYHWRKGDCNSYILSTLYIYSLLHVSILSHRCSTTVSLEIYPLYSFYYYLIFFNTLHKIFSLKNLIVMIFFSQDLKHEQERIRRTNIVVCTPGRLLQHMDETPDFTCNSLQVLGNEISTSLSCQYNINQKIMCNFSFSLVHNVNFYCGSMLCCPFLTSIFTVNYQSAIARSYLC